MNQPIRVLGIAPYEEMRALMSSLAEEYPQIQLTLFVGDREQGLEIAKRSFHGGYDVVVSRGGTASLLREGLTLPVIEVEVSMYDILSTLKLAQGLTGRAAMLTAANIARSARTLCELLECPIDLYTYDTEESIEATLEQLQRQHYQAVLCDMVADTTAKRLGMDSFLITSSAESIRKAFDQAILLCASQWNLRRENLFFRELLQGPLSRIAVFDGEGELFLSSLDGPAPELLDMLRRELPECKKEPERRIIHSLDRMLYTIRTKQVGFGGSPCTAFFVDGRKNPLSPSQNGIRFYTRPEAERAFYDSIFTFAGPVRDMQEEIGRLSQSQAPVLVSGEDGTGKETVACALYMRSNLRSGPLAVVNCNLLNEKSWHFLLEHHNSPLTDAGATIYFSSIDALSPQRRQQLLAALKEMEVCRRNRVILSCVCQTGETMSEAGSLFLDGLNCLSLCLSPLRRTPERIPALVNLSLNRLNADRKHCIVRVEPEGMLLLQRFQWPHNYTQFRRVISALTETASGPCITAGEVRQALQKERHTGAFSVHAENTAAPLDLNRTLADIDRDIVLRVVEETGGNQTAAAKRLGISRTTLWRILKQTEKTEE